MKYLKMVGVHLLWFTMGISAPLMGPGLQNATYTADQIFKPLFIIKSHDLGHGTIVMHNGYMVVIYAPDSGKRGGGFSFLNVSDLTQPTVVFDRRDSITEPIREPHGFGIRRSGDKYHVVLQAIEGLMFWDWTDINQPVLEHYLKLPDIIESDYDRGVWWSAWQGDYLYAGGSSNGLYVVKAKDPKNPEFIKKLSTSETGGFRVGPVFAVGNFLYISNMDSDKRGFSILDIGNPENPVLLSTLDSLPGYSSLVNGYKFYAVDEKLGVIDVKDPTKPLWQGQSQTLGGKGGYATFQDNFVHMGSSSRYTKIDISDPNAPNMVGNGSSGLAGRDEDFGSVMGNIVVAGNDHVEGSAIIPHQQEPDTKGPEVNMVVPYDSALNLPVTSRIGLTFTDNVELSTVLGNIVIRERGGDVLTGTFTHQVTIVNFSPDQPLKPNTTYDVIVPAGGVEDWSGNKITKPFTSVFSTGNQFSPVDPKKKFSQKIIGDLRVVPGGVVFTGEVLGSGVLDILDSRGKIIATKEIESGREFFLSTNKFSRGVYFARMAVDGTERIEKIPLFNY